MMYNKKKRFILFLNKVFHFILFEIAFVLVARLCFFMQDIFLPSFLFYPIVHNTTSLTSIKQTEFVETNPIY